MSIQTQYIFFRGNQGKSQQAYMLRTLARAGLKAQLRLAA
jgi:hypothetical protein